MKEIIKFLKTSGLSCLGSGIVVAFYTAEYLTQDVGLLIIMLIASGLIIFTGIMNLVASAVIQDEEDDK